MYITAEVKKHLVELHLHSEGVLSKNTTVKNNHSLKNTHSF